MKVLTCIVISCLLMNWTTLVAQFNVPGDGETPANAVYKAEDLQKLGWITGDWMAKRKGGNQRMLYLFHGADRLEVMDLNHTCGAMAGWFVWQDGRYYFGTDRQWVVTWIGNKDIRFDPARPGVDAMTWTRQGGQKWFCVNHTAKGDQTVLFERVDDMQP